MIFTEREKEQERKTYLDNIRLVFAFLLIEIPNPSSDHSNTKNKNLRMTFSLLLVLDYSIFLSINKLNQTHLVTVDRCFISSRVNRSCD